MKLFEIKTPTLVRSCELIATAVEGLLDGSMETKVASLLIGGAGKLTQATGTEVKVRIAAPRTHGTRRGRSKSTWWTARAGVRQCGLLSRPPKPPSKRDAPGRGQPPLTCQLEAGNATVPSNR